MKADAWKKRIISQMEGSGIYRESFNMVVNDLATVLELRDAALQQYRTEGSIPVYVHTSDRGAENPRQNPSLLLWLELQKTAIGLYKDMGLSPRSLKSIDEASMEQWEPLTPKA